MDIVFNQHPDGTFDIEYFQYIPSKEAGLAFVVIFAAATTVHVGYMGFFRAWSFIPMILGGICKSYLSRKFCVYPFPFETYHLLVISLTRNPHCRRSIRLLRPLPGALGTG